jgi:hypothetical protein
MTLEYIVHTGIYQYILTAHHGDQTQSLRPVYTGTKSIYLPPISKFAAAEVDQHESARCSSHSFQRPMMLFAFSGDCGAGGTLKGEGGAGRAWEYRYCRRPESMGGKYIDLVYTGMSIY